MPELPEVESLRRALLPRLVGRTFEGVLVSETRLRYPVDPRALHRGVAGRRVVDIARRSKYLLLHLGAERDGERTHVLVVHLGMSGRLLLEPVGAPLLPHVHIRFDLGDGDELRFRDPRRFGFVECLERSQLESDRRFVDLGPEPFAEECDGAYFYRASRRSRQPVKGFIMDARRVVGVGNIYASEALFRAEIHPIRRAGRIARRRWDALANAIREVLAAAIEGGGTTFSDWQNASGESGSYQSNLAVYDREGLECLRCGGRVRRCVLVGRSTYYCVGCQS